MLDDVQVVSPIGTVTIAGSELCPRSSSVLSTIRTIGSGSGSKGVILSARFDEESGRRGPECVRVGPSSAGGSVGDY